MKLTYSALLVLALVFTPGCCSERDATNGVSVEDYRAALTQIRDNLANNIRGSVAEVMSADTTHSQEWKDAKLELIDTTIILANDTIAGKNVAVATTNANGTATGTGQ